jgi:hypothetical protein
VPKKIKLSGGASALRIERLKQLESLASSVSDLVVLSHSVSCCCMLCAAIEEIKILGTAIEDAERGG